jgi:serine/threonine-protein kinase
VSQGNDVRPPPPRSTVWTPVRVGTAATLAVTVVAGLVLWLTGYLPWPNTHAIRVFGLKDGIFVGSSRAATTIDVFSEPLCSPCAQLATSSEHDIQRAVHEKKIAVRYHLLNYGDRHSASGDYSTRAIAAGLCVAGGGDPNRYQAFYTGLFAPGFLPKEKPASTDHADADLAHLAQTLGAPSRVSDCITSQQRMQAAKDEASNARSSLTRLQGTELIPMIFVGSREVDYADSGWLDTLR